MNAPFDVLPVQRQCGLSKGSSEENPADDAVHRAFSRVSSWHPPPHWSSHDWHAELRGILYSAAACASLDYDETRGVPLRAHIYMRATAAAWTRYRQEWSYYLHSAPESRTAAEPIAMPLDRVQADETIQYFLGHALNRLAVEDQLLIERLFWNRTREGRVAEMLQVSQQEVSRRKGRVLRALRSALKSHAALLLSQLSSLCLMLLDDLDVILDLDLDSFW
jgi:hypothetical protein